MPVEEFKAEREVELAKLLDPLAWDANQLMQMRSGAKEIYKRRSRSQVAAKEMWDKLDALLASHQVKFADITDAEIDEHLTI